MAKKKMMDGGVAYQVDLFPTETEKEMKNKKIVI